MQRSICPRPSRSGSGWRARLTDVSDPSRLGEHPGSTHSTLEALFRRAQHASLCFSPCLNRQASLCLTPCLNEQPSSPTLSPLLVLSPRFAPPGVITVALGTGGLEGILAIWTLGASPRPKVTGTLGTRGPWQFGRTGTANRIKSSVNVPSGVRAQRAIP